MRLGLIVVAIADEKPNRVCALRVLAAAPVQKRPKTRKA